MKEKNPIETFDSPRCSSLRVQRTNPGAASRR
jgi:hypothetical protein